MDNASEMLVVILASVLAINLVLGVIVLIKVIQIVNHVKKITAKAEGLVDKAEAVGNFFKHTAAPAAIGKLLVNILGQIKGGKSKKTREEEDE